jgi:hypothetical protein
MILQVAWKTHPRARLSHGGAFYEIDRSFALKTGRGRMAGLGVPQQVIDMQPKADPCCLNYIDHAQAKAWGLLSDRAANSSRLCQHPKCMSLEANRPTIWRKPESAAVLTVNCCLQTVRALASARPALATASRIARSPSNPVVIPNGISNPSSRAAPAVC